MFDPVDRVPDAPTWRCPWCRTLQPESTSCRACGRSALVCRTCQRFRSSLLGSLGFCALDVTREPLGGDEARPCWVGEGPAPLPPDGLFRDAAPPSPDRLPAPGSTAAATPATRLSLPSPTPPPEAPPPGRGRQWPGGGGWVEAPRVPPSGRIRRERREGAAQDDS